MGWNWRHNFFPVWEEDPYTYTRTELDELNARNIEYEGNKYTLYEITQMQRSAERAIRKSKRALSEFDAVLADDSVNAAVKKAFLDESVRLKRRGAKLRDIVKQTGVDRRAYRERVVGFGRGVSSRATAAAKKSLIGNLSRCIIKLKRTPRRAAPNSIVDVQLKRGGIDRTFFDD